jgi:nicotinamidase-related amidase
MRVKIPWDRSQPGRFSIEQWEIDPLCTAFLVIDMQLGYVDSTSRTGRMLWPRFPDIYRYYYSRLEQTVLPNILQLRDFFQDHVLQLVYIRVGLQLPEGRDLPPWSWRAAQVGQPESFFYPNDSPEYELVPQLAPQPHDLVLDVNSVSPFASTSLDQLLRNMGVENRWSPEF